MANGVILQFTFKGGRELDRILSSMDRKAQRNTVTRAMRRTLNPVKAKIQQRIKSELNTMNAQARAVWARQIVISINTVKQGGIAGKIRTKRGAFMTSSGHKTNFAKLGHLFERGTKAHKIIQSKRKRVIHHPGIRPNPIFATTHEQMTEQMLNGFRQHLWMQIIREFDKGI